MSAILESAPNDEGFGKGVLGPDGIRRYKTRCKILIDSHNSSTDSDTLELHEDVVAVDISKTLKGAGQASIVLLPSKNYLNLIFPNDYINIYFDIGDGSGWTRTFFGFVDRLEEDYSVDKEGIPSTQYNLICTDFYKAVERTMIYFNPHLAGRSDFTEYSFARYNIGGLALMSKGIVAGGTPPDVVTNVLLLLLGFGTQFMLPPTYRPGSTQKRLREARARLVYGRLSEDGQKELGGAIGNYEQLREEAYAEATNTVDTYVPGTGNNEEDRLNARAKSLGIKLGSYNGSYTEIVASKRSEIIQFVAGKTIREKLDINDSLISTSGSAEAGQGANYSLLESARSTAASSLSDILDVFTFVERRSMDGYLFGQPVWQKQGSLATVLRSFSNEAMNEMFFDLRPLSADSSNASLVDEMPVEGAYSRSVDDKSGNREIGTPDGITYIPSLVMREYPFSTIEGLDLRHVKIQLKESNSEEFASIGPIYFGAIFSDRPNTPGRHVVPLLNINIADKALGKSGVLGSKHLDVAVISEKEVVKTSLGRSDNDHFNLFEFYSDNLLGTDQRFYLRDILPIVTPIHLLRNGIRVRSVTTRAARFSIASIRNQEEAGYSEVAATTVSEEEATVLPVVAKGDIQSPVSSPDLARFYNGDQARWGYRRKTEAKLVTSNATVVGADVFHQGIDISKRQLGNISVDRRNEDIPIYAMAAGWVVISAPVGCYKGYGNVIVIKHKFEGIGGFRYSVYAHLKTIEIGAGVGKARGTPASKRQFAAKAHAPGVSGGTKGIYEVKKGQRIGVMGSTGFNSGNIHLHFEIDRKFPSRNDKVTDRKPLTPPAPEGRLPPPPFGFNYSGINNVIMMNNEQNSADPVLFFKWHDVNLQQEINKETSEEPQEKTEDDDQDNGSNSPEETGNTPKADALEEAGKKDPDEEEEESTTTTRTSVDTPSSRKQLIRWGLLQDHWYQHNLEYLSGRVHMRGAPEIRVGYRLDMVERRTSYYVEGVNHSWTFPNNMNTILSVSRGQPNNPYPIYVYPPIASMKATKEQRRTSRSRLATYFITPDPVAIRRSLFIKQGTSTDLGGGSVYATYGDIRGNEGNVIDDPEFIGFDQNTNLSSFYQELVSPAGSEDYTKAVMETLSIVPDYALTNPDKIDISSITGVDPSASINQEDPIEIKE